MKIRLLQWAKKMLGPEKMSYLANLSQVILAGVAIFGFFYTVQPFFQNQILSEKNAQLEKEKQKILIELEQAKTGLAPLQQNKVALQREIDLLNNQNKQLQDEISLKNQRLITSNQQMESLESRLTILQKNISFKYFMDLLQRYTPDRLTRSINQAVENYKEEKLTGNHLVDELDSLRADEIQAYINRMYGKPLHQFRLGVEKLKSSQIDLRYINRIEFERYIKNTINFLENNKDKFIIEKNLILKTEGTLNKYIIQRDLITMKMKQSEEQKKHTEEFNFRKQLMELNQRTHEELIDLISEALDSRQIIIAVNQYFHSQDSELD